MIPKLLSLLLISLLVTPAGATDHDTRSYIQKHIDISGYLGYQYVYGSPDPHPIKSNPEIGLLVNYDITDNWAAFTQFKLESDHLEQSLAYAFIEYNNTIFDAIPIQLTGGKLRHNYGLYNKDRLNPRTRPGNIAPQAMYWDQLRFALTSGWGVSVGTALDRWRLKYTISAPIVVNEKEEALIWFSGSRTTIDTSFGGHQLINLDYIADDWRIATAITMQDWGYGDAGKNTIVSVGGEKRLGPWTVSVEGLVVIKHLHNSYGFSATAQYDITDYVTIHTNYNRYQAILDDATKSKIKSLHTTHSHDVSVGVSLHQNEWELRTEFHAAKGSVWVAFAKSPTPEYADWWHYGAVSLVYHF